MNQKLISSVIDGCAASSGFTRKGSTWYRHDPEVILVVNLQKSNYGGQYYINLGVSPRELTEGEFPRDAQCHLRMRLEGLYEMEQNDPKEVERVFNLEDSSLASGEREAAMKTFLSRGIAWLEDLASIENMRRALESKADLRYYTTLKCRRFLGIE